MAKVRAAYEAFTSGDIDEFVALLAHDFVSQQSAAVPWRGSYRGPQGVRELFSRVAEHATASFEPEDFIDGGDRVVVVGRAQLIPQTTGQAFNVRELHVWHVHDARLQAMDVFLNAPVELLVALGA